MKFAWTILYITAENMEPFDLAAPSDRQPAAATFNPKTRLVGLLDAAQREAQLRRRVQRLDVVGAQRQCLAVEVGRRLELAQPPARQPLDAAHHNQRKPRLQPIPTLIKCAGQNNTQRPNTCNNPEGPKMKFLKNAKKPLFTEPLLDAAQISVTPMRVQNCGPNNVRTPCTSMEGFRQR